MKGVEWAPLMIASFNGNVQLVELLMKQRAQVDVQNSGGWSALMVASQNGLTEVVKLGCYIVTHALMQSLNTTMNKSPSDIICTWCISTGCLLYTSDAADE